MDLLYRFRFALTENRKALIKFLLSIKWNVDSEVAELPTLLDMWASIEVADALKLLGRERQFQHPLVRQFAVDTLRSASDEELLMYLLQLVQALRYEPTTTAAAAATDSVSGGSGGLEESSAREAQSAGAAKSTGEFIPIGGTRFSPLADFLISRACECVPIANSLYW